MNSQDGGFTPVLASEKGSWPFYTSKSGEKKRGLANINKRQSPKRAVFNSLITEKPTGLRFSVMDKQDSLVEDTHTPPRMKERRGGDKEDKENK